MFYFWSTASWVIRYWLDILQSWDHSATETESIFQPQENVTCFPIHQCRQPFKWQMMRPWGHRDFRRPVLLDSLLRAFCLDWSMAMLSLTFHWLMDSFDVSIWAEPLFHIVRFSSLSSVALFSSVKTDVNTLFSFLAISLSFWISPLCTACLADSLIPLQQSYFWYT